MKHAGMFRAVLLHSGMMILIIQIAFPFRSSRRVYCCCFRKLPCARVLVRK